MKIVGIAHHYYVTAAKNDDVVRLWVCSISCLPIRTRLPSHCNWWSSYFIGYEYVPLHLFAITNILVHNFLLIVIDDLVILVAMSNNLHVVHSSMYYVHKIPQIHVDK